MSYCMDRGCNDRNCVPGEAEYADEVIPGADAIRAAVEEAVLAEREECLFLVEEDGRRSLDQVAVAIRARGGK